MNIIQMSPRRFLTITTNPKKLKGIWDAVKNSPNKKWGVDQGPIKLAVCLETKRVAYHNGRHRALQAWFQGKKTIPVDLRFHSEKAFTEDHAELDRRTDDPNMDDEQYVWGDRLPFPKSMNVAGQFRRGHFNFKE